MKARIHAYVSGRVQGVFFRSSVADVAESLGLTGWVRNLPDGRVETIVEGERSSVEKVIQFCQRGPPGAYVSNLEVNWEEARGEFSTFKILY
jgi:acylphosphatase